MAMGISRDDYISRLILDGAIEFAGIDADTGEMLYSITDKLKESDPEMYNRFNGLFYQEVMKLWELGFLEINVLEENPTVHLLKKALDPEEVAKLDIDHRNALREIIRAFQERSRGE